MTRYPSRRGGFVPFATEAYQTDSWLPYELFYSSNVWCVQLLIYPPDIFQNVSVPQLCENFKFSRHTGRILGDDVLAVNLLFTFYKHFCLLLKFIFAILNVIFRIYCLHKRSPLLTFLFVLILYPIGYYITVLFVFFQFGNLFFIYSCSY